MNMYTIYTIYIKRGFMVYGEMRAVCTFAR